MGSCENATVSKSGPVSNWPTILPLLPVDRITLPKNNVLRQLFYL